MDITDEYDIPDGYDIPDTHDIPDAYDIPNGGCTMMQDRGLVSSRLLLHSLTVSETWSTPDALLIPFKGDVV